MAQNFQDWLDKQVGSDHSIERLRELHDTVAVAHGKAKDPKRAQVLAALKQLLDSLSQDRVGLVPPELETADFANLL